jgi:hypothetical protein
MTVEPYRTGPWACYYYEHVNPDLDVAVCENCGEEN